MILLAFEPKLRCEVIHASMPKKLGGNRTCGHVLCPAAHAFCAGINCRHCIFTLATSHTLHVNKRNISWNLQAFNLWTFRLLAIAYCPIAWGNSFCPREELGVCLLLMRFCDNKLIFTRINIKLKTTNIYIQTQRTKYSRMSVMA